MVLLLLLLALLLLLLRLLGSRCRRSAAADRRRAKGRRRSLCRGSAGRGAEPQPGAPRRPRGRRAPRRCSRRCCGRSGRRTARGRAGRDTHRRGRLVGRRCRSRRWGRLRKARQRGVLEAAGRALLLLQRHPRGDGFLRPEAARYRLDPLVLGHPGRKVNASSSATTRLRTQEGRRGKGGGHKGGKGTWGCRRKNGQGGRGGGRGGISACIIILRQHLVLGSLASRRSSPFLCLPTPLLDTRGAMDGDRPGHRGTNM